jgi:prepilin-type N-terminal cleavage/methylation domain-containing protein
MRRGGGFTLVEMMFVIVILGVLAAVAVVAYTKNSRKARSAEVPQVFGELKTREGMFHAEFGRYLPACPNPAGDQWEDCAEGDYWPAPLPGYGKLMDATALPARWSALKVRLPSSGLYCQYEVVAGLAGSDTNMAAIGDDLFGGAAPTRNWFYLMARCDWDGDSGTNATYWQRDDESGMGRLNEGR